MFAEQKKTEGIISGYFNLLHGIGEQIQVATTLLTEQCKILQNNVQNQERAAKPEVRNRRYRDMFIMAIFGVAVGSGGVIIFFLSMARAPQSIAKDIQERHYSSNIEPIKQRLNRIHGKVDFDRKNSEIKLQRITTGIIPSPGSGNFFEVEDCAFLALKWNYDRKTYEMQFACSIYVEGMSDNSMVRSFPIPKNEESKDGNFSAVSCNVTCWFSIIYRQDGAGDIQVRKTSPEDFDAKFISGKFSEQFIPIVREALVTK